MAAFTIFLTFLLLLAILGAGGWYAWQVHRRMNFLEGEYRRIRLAAVEDSQHSEKQIQDLKQRLDTAESRSADSSSRQYQSVNYTQRSQMLRMIRRGDAAEQIATTLGVPLSQVRLLMKLPGLTAVKEVKEKAQSA